MLSGDGTSGVDQSVGSDAAANAAPLPNDSAFGGSVLPIDAAYLAQVVASIEKNVAILGRMRTVGLPNSDRRALLVRSEAVSRALFGMSHTWLADLLAQHGLDDIYGSVPEALAVLMRFSKERAGQRIRFAEQFGERSSVTGERMDPVLPATAMAAEDGVLDEEHQDIIRLFFKRVGSKVDVETRANAERQLAQLARDLLPEEFRAASKRLHDTLDPDGDLGDDEQRADQTYMRFGDQDEHGYSKMRGLVDAEFRAYCEAAFAKWAKPGMNNPADDAPVVDEPGDGESDDGSAQDGPTLFDDPDNNGPDNDNPDNNNPDNNNPDNDGADGGVGDDEDACNADPDDEEVGAGDTDAADTEDGDSGTSDVDPEAQARAKRDHRGQGRRQHDAMKTILRQMLSSGKLGQHRGLPVTAVVTMTLKQLEEASGHAVTATGSLVRMRDAIRMASHAHQYLAIFDDDGRPLFLSRTKRIASADQRIVLLASDRGCTFPGCTRPATWSQVHHIDEWANGGGTDIDSLTLGCDQHHRLVGPSDTQWATTKAGPEHPYPGRTLWHAPGTIDPTRKGRVNHYHHPNEYIYPNPDGPPQKPDAPVEDQPGEPPSSPD